MDLTLSNIQGSYVIKPKPPTNQQTFLYAIFSSCIFLLSKIRGGVSTTLLFMCWTLALLYLSSNSIPAFTITFELIRFPIFPQL